MPTIEQVLADPCASFWLRDAIVALLNRDVVDAANDAELLAVLMSNRCKAVVGVR